jgi:hypothetical protein
VAGKPVEEYKGLSKYDSKKLVEANNGLWINLCTLR